MKIFGLWILLLGLASGQEKPLEMIAFGSCLRQDMEAPIMETIAGLKPEVFIWMGDNIYGDTEDMKVMREKYAVVSNLPAYKKLSADSRIIGTWDDHDYGANDAGKEYPMKKESQQAMLDFLNEPAGSPRRKQEGVYAYYDYGPEDKQVRIILLDTRYHRDKPSEDGTVLGEAQWKWLEETLRGSKAQVNVLVSSIQIVVDDHRFEKWANFPSDRKQLYELLGEEGVPPVILLSGDRHLAEISIEPTQVGYPLYEITSSSLNRPIYRNKNEKNTKRVGENYEPANFGTLTIDWSRDKPVVTACIQDMKGFPVRAVSLTLEK